MRIFLPGLLFLFLTCCHHVHSVPEEDTDSTALAAADSSTETSSGTNSEALPNEFVVLERDFDDQVEGETSLEITTLVSDSGTPLELSGNNTIVEIEGEETLEINAIARAFQGYGWALEFQLALDIQADMRAEDFVISFDVYIPEEFQIYQPHVQFAFCDQDEELFIVSKWHDITEYSDWTHITSVIKATDGSIVYSTLVNDPDDWIFDKVRIAVISEEYLKQEQFSLHYYVDNLRIYRPQ